MAVVLSEAARKEFRAGLLNGLGKALRGDPGRTATGQPVSQFLAGPTPNNPLGAFQHRSGRAICDRWSRGDRPQILPGRDLYYRQLCTDYLGAGVPGEPSTAPPFTGGQCPAVVYRVSGRVTNEGTSASGVPFGPVSVNGPVTGIESRPNFFDPANRIDVWVTSGAGPDVRVVSDTFPGDLVMEILSAVRQDGLPDECGDPPEEFDRGQPNLTPDPNPGPVGGPSGYPFPGLDITISPSGDIVIDFGDGEPPEVVDPTADPTSGGSGGGAEGLDPIIGAPIDAAAGPGGQDADFGPPPEGRLWVGAYLRVNGSLIPFGVAPGSAPGNSALSAVIGNATLLVDDGVSPPVRGTATQVRSEWSAHITEIVGLSITGLRVNINPALGFTIFPVSVLNPNAEGEA